MSFLATSAAAVMISMAARWPQLWRFRTQHLTAWKKLSVFSVSDASKLFSALRACHRPRRRRFREDSRSFWTTMARKKFWKWKISSLRWFPSNFRPNRGYPRDFSAVWRFCKISKVITKQVKCRFGGAVNFWALPSRSSRKVTPDIPKFSSLGFLVEG